MDWRKELLLVDAGSGRILSQPLLPAAALSDSSIQILRVLP